MTLFPSNILSFSHFHSTPVPTYHEGFLRRKCATHLPDEWATSSIRKKKREAEQQLTEYTTYGKDIDGFRFTHSFGLDCYIIYNFYYRSWLLKHENCLFVVVGILNY